jgi:hypothetical protein
MVVLTVLVGRGRALSGVSISSGGAGAYRVATVLDTFSVAPAAHAAQAAAQPAAPAEPASKGTRRPVRGAEIAGLYFWNGLENKFRADLTGRTGGSFEMVNSTSFYLLSEDGRFARGSGMPATPDGDIRRFDFDAYQRRNPYHSGTYRVDGGRVTFQMGAGTPSPETVVAPILDDGQLEISKRKYKRSLK